MKDFKEGNEIKDSLEKLLIRLEKEDCSDEDSVRLLQEGVNKIKEYLKELANK